MKGNSINVNYSLCSQERDERKREKSFSAAAAASPFKRLFTASKIEGIRLSQNFRCSRRIIACGAHIMHKFKRQGRAFTRRRKNAKVFESLHIHIAAHALTRRCRRRNDGKKTWKKSACVVQSVIIMNIFLVLFFSTCGLFMIFTDVRLRIYLCFEGTFTAKVILKITNSEDVSFTIKNTFMSLKTVRRLCS